MLIRMEPIIPNKEAEHSNNFNLLLLISLNGELKLDLKTSNLLSSKLFKSINIKSFKRNKIKISQYRPSGW